MNAAWLDRFRGCPVLVVGDLMLDEFLWGQVHRISPEAPVPVVEVLHRTFVAGGAANAAANVASLGGRPIVAGLVGHDEAGEHVVRILEQAGTDASGVVIDPDRPTTTKARVLAHSQQMLRLDREVRGSIGDAVADELLARADAVLPAARSCVLSDYGKGVAAPRLVRSLVQRCASRGIPLIVDPKGTDYAKYAGASLVKPNLAEAGRVLNRELHSESDVESAGMHLMELLGPGTSVLITRGAQGMSLFQWNTAAIHIPALAREVYDVTGAGDTVAGTIALMLGTGHSMEEACRLASVAAAIAVGKTGTVAVSCDQLREALAGFRQAA